MNGVRICVCVRLGDALARNYIRPLADHPGVETVHVVRHALVPGLAHPKVQQHIVGEAPLPVRLLKMFNVCRRLSRAREVDAVASFNPMPYGLVAMAACGRSTPYHLGFIGSDWYGPRRRVLWMRLSGVLKKASFVTATGKGMRDGISAAGVEPGRIAVLPHAIDLDRFAPGDPDKAEHELIYVGQLIRRKRVDLILKATAILAGRGAPARLCIVGDGPERDALKALSSTLGIAGHVVFAGQSDAVGDYLRRSRICVMASDMEGFPFALVEAMSCGLVPVATDVGTIRDHVQDGVNGFLVPRERADLLAEKIGVLLSDRSLCDRMRRANLDKRDGFSYARATIVWNGWIERIGSTQAVPR